MCDLISIQEKKEQIAKDQHRLSIVRDMISDHLKSLDTLKQIEKEVLLRLGKNLPDDPEAA